MVTVPPIDAAQADRFLTLLGKEPTTARLRAFPHRDNPNKWHPEHRPHGLKARKGRCCAGSCALRTRPKPSGVCSAAGGVLARHQKHASMGAMDPHQSRLGSTLQAKMLLVHLLGLADARRSLSGL